MTDMTEDYARYMRAKGLFDDARRALNAVLEDEDARKRLAAVYEGNANGLVDEFDRLSDHIVAVWN